MEEGICHLYMVTRSQNILKAKIELHIPKKKGAAATQKAETKLNKFFDNIEREIQIRFNIKDHGEKLIDSIKTVVVGSPGFIKDQFYTFLKAKAEKLHDKLLLNLIEKMILVHCSNGYK